MQHSLAIKPHPHTNCSQCSVRRLAWFAPCSTDDVRELQKMREAQFVVPARTRLYAQGDPQTRVFTLFEGWLILYRSVGQGKRQILEVALPGDMVGYQYNANKPTDHACETLTPCTLCAFTAADARTLMYRHPVLMERMLQLQEEKLQACHSALANVGQNSAKVRISVLFLRLFERLKARGANPQGRIEVPLTQEHIADIVGVTPVHVSRVCSELRAERIVDFHHGKLTLLDEARLAAMAAVYDPVPGSP